MKNLLKIGALSFALIAVVFMMNTNAQTAETGDLTLLINGESGSCTYGLNLDFGPQNFSYDEYSLTGQFVTEVNGIGDQWSCTDTLGKASRTLSIAVADVANTTTNVPAHTIPDTRVFIKNSAAQNVSGSFTTFAGAANDWANLGSDYVLMEKVGVIGDIGRLAVDSVELAINIAPSQALGQYVGVITISVPTLD